MHIELQLQATITTRHISHLWCYHSPTQFIIQFNHQLHLNYTTLHHSTLLPKFKCSNYNVQCHYHSLTSQTHFTLQINFYNSIIILLSSLLIYFPVFCFLNGGGPVNCVYTTPSLTSIPFGNSCVT